MSKTQTSTSSKAGKKKPIQSIPVVATGPLQREGVVEKLSNIAEHELGITLKLEKDSGYVIPEEQRQAERRHEETERRNLEESIAYNADMVAQLTTPQANTGENNEQTTGTSDAQSYASDDSTSASEGAGGPAPNSTVTLTPEALASETGIITPLDEAAKNAAIAQIQAMAASLGVNLVTVDSIPANTARSGRPMKNGISRPGVDTKTGKVWAAADAITAQKQRPATIKELMQSADLRNMADATIRTQYARWRAFNGISGRVQGDDDAGGRSAGSERKLQAELTKVAFPPMIDADFMRYGEMERNGDLPEGYKPWFEQEKARRNPQAPKAPQSTAEMLQKVSSGPMTDEVFERMCLLEKNNSIPEALKSAFESEKARRATVE